MTKIITVVLLLTVFSCYGQGMGISFDSKEVVRMDLWLFGVVSDEETLSEKRRRIIPEELRVALDKINIIN